MSAMTEALGQSMLLLQRAQRGDKAALEQLFARYYERVRPIVRARLGPRLREHLESGDVLQQVFIVALKNYDKFQVDSEARLIGWLAKIVQNQVNDEIDKIGAAKRKSPGHVSLGAKSASGSVMGDPPASDTRASDVVAREERQEQLEDCIAALSERHRELILLRDYQDHSWDEIATILSIASPDAARMQHATAKIELGKCLRRNSPDSAR